MKYRLKEVKIGRNKKAKRECSKTKQNNFSMEHDLLIIDSDDEKRKDM